MFRLVTFLSIFGLVPLIFTSPATVAVLKPTKAIPILAGCSKPGTFAITFDDGPGGLCDKVDDLLEATKVKASFFLNGYNIGCIYDHAQCIKRRFLRGDLIASHSWSHFLMTKLSYEQIHSELSRLEDALIKIIGVKPLYFRPPFGLYNELVLQVLAERGYRGLVLWSQDTCDSDDPHPTSAQIITAYNAYPEGANVLNHEVKDFTVQEVMPTVIPALQGKGYNLTTVLDCLDLGIDSNAWYQVVGKPQEPDSSWTCAA